MVAEQSMTKALMQTVIEAAKAAIMALKEADKPVSITKPVHNVPGSSSPTL